MARPYSPTSSLTTSAVAVSGTGTAWAADVDFVLDLAAQDFSTAYASFAGAGTSENLNCTTFAASVPSRAAIAGIEFSVRGGRVTMTSGSVSLQLLVSGSPVGSAVSRTFSASATTYTLGGLGAFVSTNLTPSLVGASDFGVRIVATAGGAGAIYLDLLRMRVWYEDGHRSGARA